MFHLIRGSSQIYGSVAVISNDLVWVEASYQWTQSTWTYYLHPMIDDRTKTVTYFAFDSLELKQIFAKLLKISGIWPKTAFTIAHIPPEVLQQAVDTFDIWFVQSIPGIGPKTAKKIIIELKDSLKSDDVAKLQIDKALLKSITTMLKNFGYPSQQITTKLSQCPIQLKQDNLQEIITRLVKNM